MAEDQGRETAGRAWEPLGETDPWDVGRHAPLDLLGLDGVCVLVGTKKGAFFITSNAARDQWTVQGPVFFGYIIHHMIADPRDRATLLIAARTGHLGPTVFRSNDLGKTWREASRPPAFAEDDRHGRIVEQVFHLTPGRADEPGVWYAGTSPECLFRSEDGGDTWWSVAGWNDNDDWLYWTDPAGEFEFSERPSATPDGSPLHSILLDPRDTSHLYIAQSAGGVFESTDSGENWGPLNSGCEANFLPDPYPEIGQDPHCVIIHPADPDVLYQQNHCGIYRLDRPATVWDRIGDNMPDEIGDIGFAIVTHPRDVDTAWVFPMDGTDVWPRTSVAARPAVYCTRDGGNSWQRQDSGLPVPGWYTVYRQAMSVDDREPAGVYFGATCGEVWGSANEGSTWQMLAGHLPQIYAIEAFELGG